MKKLLATIALCSVFVCGNAFAHAEHGVITSEAAINIAAKSVKQMTFKDFGFEVGKLDDSWKQISAEQVTVVSVEADFYVVNATNKASNKQLFFKIGNHGQVVDVKHNNNF